MNLFFLFITKDQINSQLKRKIKLGDILKIVFSFNPLLIVKTKSKNVYFY